MTPDPKPAARVVDKNAQPLDARPLRTGRCPLCHRRLVYFSRHHVVPKGQGGDDLPENLVWVCGDGTRGCHGVLTHRNRGDHGMTFEDVALRLVRYVQGFPLMVAYADAKRWPGFLDDYYVAQEAA